MPHSGITKRAHWRGQVCPGRVRLVSGLVVEQARFGVSTDPSSHQSRVGVAGGDGRRPAGTCGGEPLAAGTQRLLAETQETTPSTA